MAEHETAQKKGRAAAMDPSIMVLEEDLAVKAPTKPDELITLQPGGGSRWFVQRMPRLGNAAGGSTLISCHLDMSMASTPEHAEGVTVQQIPTVLAPQAAQVAQQAVVVQHVEHHAELHAEQHAVVAEQHAVEQHAVVVEQHVVVVEQHAPAAVQHASAVAQRAQAVTR